MHSTTKSSAKHTHGSVPPVPREIGNLGIPELAVIALVLRRAQIEGTTPLGSLSQTLKLSHGIVSAVFWRLQQQKLVEVRGMVGEDCAFQLTGTGHRLAANCRELCHYSGPAPVSLPEYNRMVRAQAAKVKLDMGGLREAFSDLVVTDEQLSQIGPALVSQTSLFLWIYRDVVFVPYAVEVDGQAIVVYDPVMHERVDYLSLSCGVKFSIPFEPMVVFSTNLNPRRLADEAILRRIHNKVYAGAAWPWRGAWRIRRRLCSFGDRLRNLETPARRNRIHRRAEFRG